MGGPVKIGIDLAVEEWNKRVISSSRNTLLKDNQKLVVTPVDDKCEPSQALVAANDLVSLEKSIQVVIGHNCSGAAIEAAPIYDSHKLLMISTFATNPRLTDVGHKLVFRMVGRDDDQADAAASYIASNRTFGTVAIVHDDQPYGRELASLVRRSLRNRGITEAMFVEVHPPTDDEGDSAGYGNLVKEIAEKRIDVIYYAGYPSSGVALRKKTWSGNVTVPMLSGDGFLTEDYVQLVGAEAASQTFMALFGFRGGWTPG